MFQIIVHGAEVCSPILILFAKNSTLATEPSASLALAVMVIALPSSNCAAVLGEVTATRGNWLGAGARTTGSGAPFAFTITRMEGETVTVPLLAVTLTLSTNWPTDTPFQPICHGAEVRCPIQ